MSGGAWQSHGRGRDPFAKHGAADFDVGATYVPDRGQASPYAADRGGESFMDPRVSVSKFDGRPLFEPPERDARSQGNLSPNGRGMSPVSPGGQPAFMNPEQSVSRFDGRPIGTRADAPLLAPYPAAVQPVDPRHVRQDYRPSPDNHRPPDDLKTDCMGGGNALVKRIKALFLGAPAPVSGGGVCFYDDRAEATGMSQGVMDQTFQFVGQRNYEEVPQRHEDSFAQNAPVNGMRGMMMDPPAQHIPHWRMRPCTMYLLLTAAVLVAVAVLYGLVTLLLSRQGQHFDCDADLMDALSGWSFQKKAWCCENQQKGCAISAQNMRSSIYSPEELGVYATSTSTTTGTLAAFQCQVLRLSYWSPGEVAWCCLYKGRGCPVQTTPLPWNCEENLERWPTEWPQQKKAWCCEHQRVGCGTQNAAAVLPPKPIGVGYDCSVGFDNWQVGWSIVKKAWCCEFENKACPYTTTTQALSLGGGGFACDANCDLKGVVSTCKNRVSWLVQHQTKSCEQALGAVVEECDICRRCELGATGCRDPYDCRTDGSYWGQAQKDFCCKTASRGCAAVLVEPSKYDCKQDFAQWSQKWSIPKRFWCCSKEGMGCETHTCRAGDPKGWGLSQQFWCCESEKKGCDALPFDCDAGYASWYLAWSPEKQKWCCDHLEKGCAEFDCNAGFSSCAIGWSTEKKIWCGVHGKSCLAKP